MVSHLSVDIKSINIVQIFLDSTCLLEITNLVNSPVWLIVVAIVLPDGVRDFSPSIEPMLVGFPLLQRISFRTWANVGQSLNLVAGLYDGEVIIHLKDPSF